MSWPVSNPIAREMEDFWQESQTLFQQWWVQADLDTKMATGQQDYWDNQFNFGNYRNQKQLQFNKILRIINMIGGYQRDSRLATIVSPADNDPDMGKTAEQLSTVLNWCMKKDATYERISDCFDGSNVCGLNLMQVYMDFREDPENGEILTHRLPFNSFIMDPYWTDPSLKKDCDRIWVRRYLTKRHIVSIFPKIAKELTTLGKGYAAKDGKFQYLAQNWYQYQQEMYAYDEYWVKDYRTTRKLIDKATGEVAEWKGTKEQFQLLRQINPNVDLISAQVPTIKMYILINSNLVYEEKSPYGLDRFPFVPFICYHFPEVQNYSYRFQGVVRNIRDSQVELNRRRNRMLDVLDAQIQSGLMVKEDALVNPEDAFFQGPGKVLYFKQTANLASDVAPIPAPPVAQGWMELIQTIESEIMDIVGPEELFAQNMNAKDMTSVLMKLKMGAGLTGLRNIFDRLNQAQMNIGDIMLDMIQNNFEVGKVDKILGEQPTQEFSQGWLTKYHCTVEEAELTNTQRGLQLLQALQLKQMGIPISNKYVIEKSNLQDKKGVIEDIQAQEQQAAQIEQAQIQQQMQQSQVLTRSLEAKAQNDFAAAEERKSRAVSDIALAKERVSQAVHDRASAALENAKALKELQDMDEDRLIKLANFVVDLQIRQKEIQGGEEGDAITESLALDQDIELANLESKPSSPNSQLSQAIGNQ